jgi:hypothetical protein
MAGLETWEPCWPRCVWRGWVRWEVRSDPLAGWPAASHPQYSAHFHHPGYPYLQYNCKNYLPVPVIYLYTIAHTLQNYVAVRFCYGFTSFANKINEEFLLTFTSGYAMPKKYHNLATGTYFFLMLGKFVIKYFNNKFALKIKITVNKIFKSVGTW